MYGSVLASTSAPCSTAWGGIPCVMSMICGVRRDPLDHAVAGADEVVLEPEVGEEGDEHRLPRVYDAARPAARPLTAGPATATARPALECSSASATTSRPAARAAREVSGPIDTTAKPSPSAASARAAEGEVSTTRSAAGNSCGPQLAGPVERDDVCVERLGEHRARTLGGREQHTTGGPWELGEQPLLRRHGRHEVGAAERLGRRRADRGQARHLADRPPPELAGAVRARHDDPVVAGDVDRVVAERLDRDQRAVDDLVAEALEAGDEIPLLALGSSDDDPHRASGNELRGERGRVEAGATLDPGAVLGGDQRRQHGPVVVARRRVPGSRRRSARRSAAPPRPARGSRRRRPGRRAPPRRPGPGGRARPAPPPAASPSGSSRSPISAPSPKRSRPQEASTIGVEASLAPLAQARVDVAAQRLDREASARGRAAGPGGGQTRFRSASRAGSRRLRRARRADPRAAV